MKNEIKKIVLAYSGGLDTSVIIKWLKEKYPKEMTIVIQYEFWNLKVENDYFKINIKDKICLDIGASTGGFTQVLLKKEARKIYSVDVGKNQLHEKLRVENKIINIEKTNARYLTSVTIEDKIDIIDDLKQALEKA